MAELRADVIGQIEEMSTLVGDLVDLARSVFLDPTPVGAVPPPGW